MLLTKIDQFAITPAYLPQAFEHPPPGTRLFHQEAADELRGNLLGGSGEEGLGKG